MEMFLMALCISVFGLAVSAIAFSAATGGAPAADADERAAKPVVRQQVERPAFFAVTAPGPAPKVRPQVPVEVLLLQLEHHIRLEQAAAESFLHYPSAEALHSRTTSPLVH